jgi:flagellar motor switch protein FliN/FliY
MERGVSHVVTPREALMRLGASTAEAVAQVLEAFAPGAVERGDVTVLPDGQTPFSNLPSGALATSVSYVDGVTGANIFVLAPVAARALATAMGVPPPEPVADGELPEELSELELSAVAEAANQTMAAAASAISLVIGHEIEIGPPDTRVLTGSAAAAAAYGKAPHATSTTFLVAGEACRLIQLIPAAFVMRMVRAIDELGMRSEAGGETLGGGHQVGRPGGDAPSTLGVAEAIGGVKLRVWAELGRTRLPLGRALQLPLGAVVDLDCEADAPVDLFVNGLCFAQGHLLVTDDGEWAIVIDELGGRRDAAEPAAPMAAQTEPQPEGASI